ncbi:hypothetical protein DPEC_G00290730 [Dallia pectoralis]|uniref:Uncharacterized protein n=1 Tax=Dallia pectoralis TaxID=75939 RepID=A0ACC2FHF9_DALPE|nr:hypothetical protein DPEC_G00290730 [Dallia pectoralis]
MDYTCITHCTGPSLVYGWLQTLHLHQYLEGFVDNGYDDLEVCKHIGNPDLDAIGVHVRHHRHRLLQAVEKLREEKKPPPGLYFTLEPVDPSVIGQVLDSEGYLQGSRSWTGSNQETSGVRSYTTCHQGSHCSGNNTLRLANDSKKSVTFPKLKLKILIRDKLLKDGINLTKMPYTQKVGSYFPIHADLRRAFAH